MIADKLENLALYRKLAPEAWQLVADFLKTVTPATEKGRYKLDGDKVMADVLYYDTKKLADCKVELHKRYIDIQVVLAGSETICCMPTDDLAVIEVMDVERDRGFFTFKPSREVRLPMQDGSFEIGRAHV